MPPSPLLLLFAILQNDTTGGETSGVVGQAKETGRQLEEGTGTVLRGSLARFFDDIGTCLTSTEFIANIVATAVVGVAALAFYRVAVHLIPRVLRWRRPQEDSLDARSLARIKRQDTTITLLHNALRYAVFIIVALFVFSIFFRNVLPAVAGASILAAGIGFGAQSFLRDIIAGFFILFENQYSVGDFITIEPQKVSGMVEEFGLKTTKIRALSGELTYVPNGSLIAVTNYVSGQQHLTIEVQLKDEEAAQRVLKVIQEGHELYLTSPRLAQREKLPEGGLRLRLLAGVLPSMSWLIEENLVERIRAAASEDGLAAAPLVYKVDSRNVRRLKDFIPEG